MKKKKNTLMIKQDVNMEMNRAVHWSLVVNDIISNVSPEATTQEAAQHNGSQGRFWSPTALDSSAVAKSLQSCPTLCDRIDGSPAAPASPWDSPGKNTGVGCHFFLQCMKVKSESEVA